jgi:hypothetical protein
MKLPNDKCYKSIISYTTPSTVNEVSAIFVETINRQQLGGGGLNTRACRVITNIRHNFIESTILLTKPHGYLT